MLCRHTFPQMSLSRFTSRIQVRIQQYPVLVAVLASFLTACALNAISPASVLYLRAHGNACPYFTIRNQNGTTLGQLGGLDDRILIPRASAHEALLLGIPDGVIKWGRKVVEVKETADAAQVVFEDSTVETCDLVIGADGIKSVCRQALFGKEAYQAQYEYVSSLNRFIILSPMYI